MIKKIQKIILLVDSSGSMDGEPIEDIKKAIHTLEINLPKINKTSNVKHVLKVICFSTIARYINPQLIDTVKAIGRTNLANAYTKLSYIFNDKYSFDYSPIIILLCDGNPNLCDYQIPLNKLKKKKTLIVQLKLLSDTRLQIILPSMYYKILLVLQRMCLKKILLN